MSLVYRKVDILLSANAGGEVREGDCILLDTGCPPREGALVLVRRGKTEAIRRWKGGGGGDVLGVVIGIKRKL